MNRAAKLRTFAALDLPDKLRFLEALWYLAVARLMIIVPFARIAPSLGLHMQETGGERDERAIGDLRRVHLAIKAVSRHTPWGSTCLVRAIAAMKMLERRGIDSTLYMGTARDEAGMLIAHAWLRSGPFYLTGDEEMHRFSAVATFAKLAGRRASLDERTEDEARMTDGEITL